LSKRVSFDVTLSKNRRSVYFCTQRRKDVTTDTGEAAEEDICESKASFESFDLQSDGTGDAGNDQDDKQELIKELASRQNSVLIESNVSSDGERTNVRGTRTIKGCSSFKVKLSRDIHGRTLVFERKLGMFSYTTS
jgi:hypothetical protein